MKRKFALIAILIDVVAVAIIVGWMLIPIDATDHDEHGAFALLIIASFARMAGVLSALAATALVVAIGGIIRGERGLVPVTAISVSAMLFLIGVVATIRMLR